MVGGSGTPLNQAAVAVPAFDHAAALYALLQSVADPEIPVVSIVDLGIVRAASEAEVVITPTYSGCPAMGAIETQVRATLDAAGYTHTRIRTTLAPAWTTDWMTAAAHAALRDYGIAPPLHRADARNEGRQVTPLFPQCPQCGSRHTERLSQFGSTACKALYRCCACREPFDYFKPL